MADNNYGLELAASLGKAAAENRWGTRSYVVGESRPSRAAIERMIGLVGSRLSRDITDDEFLDSLDAKSQWRSKTVPHNSNPFDADAVGLPLPLLQSSPAKGGLLGAGLGGLMGAGLGGLLGLSLPRATGNAGTHALVGAGVGGGLGALAGGAAVAGERIARNNSIDELISRTQPFTLLQGDAAGDYGFSEYTQAAAKRQLKELYGKADPAYFYTDKELKTLHDIAPAAALGRAAAQLNKAAAGPPSLSGLGGLAGGAKVPGSATKALGSVAPKQHFVQDPTTMYRQRFAQPPAQPKPQPAQAPAPPKPLPAQPPAPGVGLTQQQLLQMFSPQRETLKPRPHIDPFGRWSLLRRMGVPDAQNPMPQPMKPEPNINQQGVWELMRGAGVPDEYNPRPAPAMLQPL